MAERKQVQEAQWEERPPVFFVSVNLALDWNHVGQKISMRDDDALGFRGGS
jgi:hypothetical protein